MREILILGVGTLIGTIIGMWIMISAYKVKKLAVAKTLKKMMNKQEENPKFMEMIPTKDLEIEKEGEENANK